MKCNKWIISGPALFLALSSSQCKTIPHSPADSELRDYETKTDVNLRLNPPLWRVQIANTVDASTVWSQYNNGEYAPPKWAYEAIWNQSLNFVYSKKGSSDPNFDDKSSMWRKNYRVRFYISVKQPVFGAPPVGETGPQTEQEFCENIGGVWTSAGPTDGRCETQPTVSLTKTCGDGHLAENARVVTYDLCAYKQPVLTRNFLVLAKLGYFDGKPLIQYRQGGKVTSQLLMSGVSYDTEEPFFFPPDPIFTDRTQTINSAIFDAKTPLTQRSAGDEISAGSRMSSETSNGGLVALAFNPVEGDVKTRMAYAFKIGFAEFRSAITEVKLGYDKVQNFPVPFGFRKQEPELNTLRGRDFRQLQSDLAARKNITIECVEILEPKESPVYPQWAIRRAFLERNNKEITQEQLQEEIRQGSIYEEFDFRDVADLVDCEYDRNQEDL